MDLERKRNSLTSSLESLENDMKTFNSQNDSSQSPSNGRQQINFTVKVGIAMRKKLESTIIQSGVSIKLPPFNSSQFDRPLSQTIPIPFKFGF